MDFEKESERLALIACQIHGERIISVTVQEEIRTALKQADREASLRGYNQHVDEMKERMKCGHLVGMSVDGDVCGYCKADREAREDSARIADEWRSDETLIRPPSAKRIAKAIRASIPKENP